MLQGKFSMQTVNTNTFITNHLLKYMPYTLYIDIFEKQYSVPGVQILIMPNSYPLINLKSKISRY